MYKNQRSLELINLLLQKHIFRSNMIKKYAIYIACN